MASPSSYSHKPNAVVLDPTPPPNNTTTTTTTFVQADPSNFRAVVQKLTGAPSDPSTPKLPVTLSSRLPAGKPTSGDMGPRKQPFKLQERRQSGKKLELQLNNNNNNDNNRTSSLGFSAFSPRQRMMMFSPVSPLDMLLLTRGNGNGSSPRTPMSPIEQEERAIADKGFFLHPSPLTTPRGSDPELLPLFPLHSPKLTHDSSSNS
ncbi:VQ domain-containing protein [Heracleum sosnowskyi]|uniref:VQ domain-containing protein n=1 Tax=Heracleum sosnowskyi TaxID=360622 RepID=A0AAD8H312_9APIA|nr:VQ domain-containing protein [Heracleum sosnowskyi]